MLADGVLNRGDAEVQGRQVAPLLLGVDVSCGVVQVGVDIDETGNHGLSGAVDLGGPLGNVTADGHDAAAIDDHGRVLQDLVAVHGDHPGMGQGHDTLGLVAGERDLDRLADHGLVLGERVLVFVFCVFVLTFLVLVLGLEEGAERN